MMKLDQDPGISPNPVLVTKEQRAKYIETVKNYPRLTIQNISTEQLDQMGKYLLRRALKNNS